MLLGIKVVGESKSKRASGSNGSSVSLRQQPYKKNHSRSEDSREVFLHHCLRDRTEKEARQSELPMREGCRHPPRGMSKLRREAEKWRRTLDRFQPEVQAPVQ
ncbi:hypothetical protein TNIN_470501 [Trichonephila inaurata madagascariensis]|uniref:Uncharacterized protein n=1 Tax=Trichonephila inaurata madagascariensis TaxID=2747483 RepID=A0A8X6X661_9ARAC|nr:hypothetical protein TNIN_470501 [Trichonephila inaurata madagascariensis]